MKTVLVEPLVIREERLQELAKPLQENGNEWKAYDSKPTTVEEWVSRVGDAEQIIVANTKMPVEVIEQCKNLKYIRVAFTGLDHIPMEAAEKKGIVVTNAAGYSDEGVAELVIGMTIGIYRKISEADQAVRHGGRSADFLGKEIAGKTVGIIGTGHIGLRVAEVFRAFGAKLLGYNRSIHKEAEALGVRYVMLDELLEQSDIVTVHLPQNEDTKGFISARELRLMKQSAILINCARGPIVNSKDLMEALKNGTIAGAGVDVFDQEPPLSQDELLLQAPNLLVTPHIAYFTEEAMERRAEIVFQRAYEGLK